MSRNLSTAQDVRDDSEMNKGITVRLRISPEDHAAWLKAADADKASLSDWIRRRCDGRPATGPDMKVAKKAKK